MNGAGSCRCMHHKVMPVLIILFGLLFLLGYFNVFTAPFVAMSWPVLVIVAGLAKLFSGSCKCYSETPHQ
jgi:hypothetical protein